MRIKNKGEWHNLKDFPLGKQISKSQICNLSPRATYNVYLENLSKTKYQGRANKILQILDVPYHDLFYRTENLHKIFICNLINLYL